MSNSPSVETTDIVTVIEEEQSYREMWKLRKVQDVYPAGDGLIRGATNDRSCLKQGERKCLRRPLQKLFPLEIRDYFRLASPFFVWNSPPTPPPPPPTQDFSREAILVMHYKT